MDLHVFRHNPVGLQTRLSGSSIPTQPAAAAVVTSPTSLHARASTGGLSHHHNRHHHHYPEHQVSSPRPFHSLSTPTQGATHPRSPTLPQLQPPPLQSPPQHHPRTSSLSPISSMFSIFSRAQQPPGDNDDHDHHDHRDHHNHNHQIMEVEEASGHRRHSHNSRSPPPPLPLPQSPKQQQQPQTDPRHRSSLQYSVTASSHHRLSTMSTATAINSKWDKKPWYTLRGLGGRLTGKWTKPRKSQWRRLFFWLSAVGLFLFCFLLVFVLPNDLQRLAPVVIGALLSFISTLAIMVSFLLQPQTRRYPNELLVYVAMCEFGLAIVALAHVMAYCSHSDNSYDCDALSFHACGITTTLEMFLLLASVGWFGCAIWHLFVSVSNPFANYKSQLKRYHLTVWGGSIVVALLVPLVVFSESSQSQLEMSGVEICRAVGLNFPLLPQFTSDDDMQMRLSQWQTLTMEYWGALFALVVVLVIAAQSILAVGWWRSNSGTVVALKARRRMMKRMTTYVHTLNATWLVILVVFFTYRSDAGALQHLAEISMSATKATSTSTRSFWSNSSSTTTTSSSLLVGINALDAFFHYILAAKGYFTCVVWLAVNKQCCAVGLPVLCKGLTGSSSSAAVAAGTSGGYYNSSDEEDDSDHETCHQVSGASGTLGQPPGLARGSRTSTIGRGTSGSGGLQSSLSFTGEALPLSPSPPPPPSVSASAVYASQNNETLQREIIYYSVCGITKSILKSAQDPDTSGGVFFQQLMVGADSAEVDRASSSSLGGPPVASPSKSQWQQQPQTPPFSPRSQLSPRAYCHSSHAFYDPHQSLHSSFIRSSSGDGNDNSMASTGLFSASFMSFSSSAGGRASLTLRDLGRTSERQDEKANLTQHHSFSGTTAFSSGGVANNSNSSSFSFSTTTTTARAVLSSQRVSMYPVSHVPFELFEQEIELQSHRSSEGSRTLSPMFAHWRRTAHALYHNTNPKTTSASATTTTTATAVPRPSMTSNRPSTTSRSRSGSVENPRPKLFIDYAPTEFRAIRRAYGLCDEMYLASFRSTAKERVSAGSSGAFMFFSGDNSLIVKSMKEKECRKLVEMIPAYAEFVTKNPKSRIIRFFGCHRIRLYGRNFYFVVMSNVLHSSLHTGTITEKYDVKGSWIDRQAKLPQNGDLVTCSECNATYEYGRSDASTGYYPFHVHRPDTILKDLDLKRQLRMGTKISQELYTQLEMDCEFLNSMGIMDYSLLVGVHKCSRPPETEYNSLNSLNLSFLQQPDLRRTSTGGSEDGGENGDCGCHLEPIPEQGPFPEEMYFIGIIDILQEWNWEKQLEKVGKTLIGKSSSGISAVAPDAYCQRFKARLAQVLGLVPPTKQKITTSDEEALLSSGGGARLVTQPSMHPIAAAEQLAFELQDDHQCQSQASFPVHQEDDDDDFDGQRPSEEDDLDDEELRFEAEAIAVSIDLEVGGRVSQRL